MTQMIVAHGPLWGSVVLVTVALWLGLAQRRPSRDLPRLLHQVKLMHLLRHRVRWLEAEGRAQHNDLGQLETQMDRLDVLEGQVEFLDGQVKQLRREQEYLRERVVRDLTAIQESVDALIESDQVNEGEREGDEDGSES